MSALPIEPDGAPAGPMRPTLGQLAPPLVAVMTVTLTPGLLGALAVQLREDIGLTPGKLGATISIFYLAAALSAMRLSWVGERFGAGPAFRVGAVASGAALAGVAVFAQSFWSLVGFVALAGLANSLVQPAANLYLARTVDPRRMGLALGIKQSAIPLGTLFCGLAVPTIALTVGWRWVLVGGLIAAVATYLLAPDQATVWGGRDRSSDMAVGPMLVLAAGGAFGAMAAGVLSAFLVDSATESGVANGAAGLIAAAGSIIGLTTRLVSGVRADRRGGGHLRIVGIMLSTGAVMCLLLATMSPVAYVLAGPIAFSTAWGWPALFYLSVINLNPQAPAAASGLIGSGTYAGLVVGPLVFGWLAEHHSYRVTWIAAAGCSAAGAVTITIGRRLIVRAQSRRAELASGEVVDASGVSEEDLPHDVL